MRVHLLRQLARDLDRLDLGGERTAERPLDEVLDPLLQISKNADAEASSWTALRRSCARAAPALRAG